MANQHVSDWIAILIGVPQGSVLSALLFIFFIIDMTHRIPAPFSYADDLTTRSTSSSLETCIINAKNDLENIGAWCKRWGQVYHKTEFIIHTPNGTPAKADLAVSGIAIKQVESQKLLGMVINEKLAFKNHIDYISGRSLSALNGVSHVTKHMSCETALSICNAIITSIITTSYPVWCSNTNSKQLEAVYRQVLIRCTKAFSSTSAANPEVFTHSLPLDLKLTETLLNEWSRLQRTADDFPLKVLATSLQTDQVFLQQNPNSFVSQALQHQLDLNINLSNIEPQPVDSMNRILK